MRNWLIVFACLVLPTALGLTLSGCNAQRGCNAQIIDTTYYYDTAIISLPDGGVVKGKVSSWKDYEDSDAVQVVVDGVTYYTFLGNVVLVAE
jgi:hypothetical protein